VVACIIESELMVVDDVTTLESTAPSIFSFNALTGTNLFKINTNLVSDVGLWHMKLYISIAGSSPLV
jgi:hypothetical protein